MQRHDAMQRVLRTPFAAGLLFGLGLCLSGMTDPRKVKAFLDLAGEWDPSLAFVMGGAIVVALPVFRIARKRRVDLFEEPVHSPTRNAIDPPLMIGAAIFGAGWGLVGLCPGPAVSRTFFSTGARSLSNSAMLVGMAIHAALARSTGLAPIAAPEQDG